MFETSLFLFLVSVDCSSASHGLDWTLPFMLIPICLELGIDKRRKWLVEVGREGYWLRGRSRGCSHDELGRESYHGGIEKREFEHLDIS